jgi:hypothetical protein
MIGARSSAIALLIILGALAVFHILMLAGVLPPDIAWGGRATGAVRTLRVLETVGLFVTVLFAAMVAAKIGFIGGSATRRIAGVAMWVVFAYFTLNVFSNLVSASGIERAIFAPVSIVVALLALRLAVHK